MATRSGLTQTELPDTTIPEQVAGARSAVQDTRDKIVDLYNQVGETYTRLVNAGRQEEAASLRDAAERFARAGSQTGISSDQRIASLQELAGSLRVAGQMAEGQIEAQGISQTLQILQTLAGLDQNVLSDSFRDAYGKLSSQEQADSKSKSPLQISDAKNIRRLRPRSPLSGRTAADQRMAESQARLDAVRARPSIARDMLQRSINENAIRQAVRGTQAPGGMGAQPGSPFLAPSTPFKTFPNPTVPLNRRGTPSLDTPATSQVAGAQPALRSPMDVAQAKGRAADPLSTSGGFVLGQTVKNIGQDVLNAGRMALPTEWWRAGSQYVADRLYNTGQKPQSFSDIWKSQNPLGR